MPLSNLVDVHTSTLCYWEGGEGGKGGEKETKQNTQRMSTISASFILVHKTTTKQARMSCTLTSLSISSFCQLLLQHRSKGSENSKKKRIS